MLTTWWAWDGPAESASFHAEVKVQFLYATNSVLKAAASERKGTAAGASETPCDRLAWHPLPWCWKAHMLVDSRCALCLTSNSLTCYRWVTGLLPSLSALFWKHHKLGAETRDNKNHGSPFLTALFASANHNRLCRNKYHIYTT